MVTPMCFSERKIGVKQSIAKLLVEKLFVFMACDIKHPISSSKLLWTGLVQASTADGFVLVCCERTEIEECHGSV